MFGNTALGEAEIARLFDAAPNPYVILDRDLTIVGANAAYLEVTGRSRDDIVGKPMFEAFPSDPDSASFRLLHASFEKVLATGKVDHLPFIPYAIVSPEGQLRERFWSATHTPVLSQDGGVRYILQHTVDVTELHLLRMGVVTSPGQLIVETDMNRRADAVKDENIALGKEREYLRSLFEQAPSFMAVLRGPDHVFDLVNDAYTDLIGGRDVIGKAVHDALPEVRDQGFVQLLDRVYGSGMPYSAFSARVSLARRGKGAIEDRFLDFIYQPIRDRSGQTIGIFVQGHDVTEKKLAEDAARESEARFRSLAQSLPNHVWTALPDGRLDWFNNQVYHYSGDLPGDLDGENWIRMVHPDDIPGVGETWRRSVTDGNDYQTEFRLRRHDGAWRWFIARAIPLKDEAGQVTRWIGTNTDIEDQKRTEAQLEYLNETLEERVEERTAELLQTQEVLRQSQKMEAIGNLAGGIAHDFNNLLQVISGNLQLLSRDVVGVERAERSIANALSGVSRGAKLASQLLSFGRRQPLQPKVVNLGRMIRDTDNLIRRSLGEAIEIKTVIAPELWNTLVDPTNVENALLNLAINARDAMDGRGSLTIEVDNVHLERRMSEAEPGDYVMLSVSDTGAGIPPDVIDKVFEPFFTTKPEGRGTGLGLSMVYGFVKQSGGHVRLTSEVARGTTIRLYLPRSFAREDVVETEAEVRGVGGSETILVIEDDEAVRETTVGLLGELGYKVLSARDADSALPIVESDTPLDLIFTDVVMPGRLKSRDLAERARQLRPGVAVLFTSGYSENSIVHGGRLDPDIQLLGKPYRREALAGKVRQMLDFRRPIIPVPPPQETNSMSTDHRPGLEGCHVLLVEDEGLIRMNTADILQDMGITVSEAGSAAEATALGAPGVDILMVDVGLPDRPGTEVAIELRAANPKLKVIFATGNETVPGSEAIPGAVILTKPYDETALRRILETVLAQA